jgi:hypothetical protein
MSAATFARDFPFYMTRATAAALIKRSKARRVQHLVERQVAARVARFEGSVGNVVPFPGKRGGA